MSSINRCLLLAAASLAAGLIGCGNNPHEMQQLNAFLQHPRSPVSGTEYRVLPPDTLMIQSQHVPEINNQKLVIRPDGKINLPLLGEIMVAGHTPREIEIDLKRAARDYYAEVDATVDVLDYKSQKYYVFGMVAKAGPQPWTGRDTLMDALAISQPTNLALVEKIKVVRGKAPTSGGYLPSVDYRNKDVRKENENRGRTPLGNDELEINLWEVVRDGDMSHNVLLKADDVVFVPPHPMVAIGLELERILYPLRAIFGVLYAPATVAGAL